MNEFNFVENHEKHELSSDKNVDVYNALNLFNPELGTMYEQQGYNPYDENFTLTEEYTSDVLNNKKNTNDVLSQDFLEKNNKDVAKSFNKALACNNDILNTLNTELENTTDQKLKKQINQTIIVLKNRAELLKLNIEKLKQKDANALKMYQEIFGLDSEISELLCETYTDKANTQFVVQQMMALLYKRSTTKNKINVPKIPTKQIENQIQITQ